MVTGVTHDFVSAKAQGGDATVASKDEWNAAHAPNLTTKGDIIAEGAATAGRLAVGSNDEALVAASGESLGLKYAAVILASLLTTRGDIIYRNATVPARLAKGTSGYVLKQGANDPAWGICPTLDLAAVAGDILYATGADTLAKLAIGTVGQLLVVNSGATALEYASLGTRSLPLPIFSFRALTGSPVQATGSTSIFWQLGKESSSILGQFIVPEDYSADGVFRIYYTMASATSGDVRWFTRIASKAEGEDLNTSGSEDIVDDTVQGTAVNVGVLDITTSETLAAGDVVNVLVGRSGAHGNDTAAGNANLHMVAFRYTPSL
jgi:hypothetical protein